MTIVSAPFSFCTKIQSLIIIKIKTIFKKSNDHPTVVYIYFC